MTEALETVGTVESPSAVHISPRVTARIEYIKAREGDPVKRGEVLVRLDPTELQAQVSQQEASAAQARSRLAEALLQQAPTAAGVTAQMDQQRAAVQSAEADLNQTERTAEAQIADAQANVDQEEAAVRVADAALTNARAELTRDEATLRHAESRLRRAEELLQKGYVSQQSVEDARNQRSVAEGSVNVSKGRIESAKAAVDAARARRTGAVKQLEITRRRTEADRVAAKARLVQAKASLNVADANRAQNPALLQNIAALRSSVVAAEAQVTQAKTRLRDTVLVSPIDGSVTERTADAGSLASAGQPLLTVQSLDWLYVTSSVSAEAVAAIRKGQSAELSFEAFPDRVFRGTVAHINPAANPESRRFQVRVTLKNPDNTLKAGMYANVRLATRTISDAIVVPKEAVKTTDAGPTLTVVDPEGKADIRPVVLGISDRTGVQIVTGIRAGEKVVTLSYQQPRQGQEVRLADSQEPRSGRDGATSESNRARSK